jgi:hypothetical protein
MKKIFLFAVLAMSIAAIATGCKKEAGPQELTLSSEEFRNVPFEGIALSLTITTGADWEITDIPEWIDVDPAAGTGTARVDIEVKANDGDLRQAVLTVTAGEQVRTVTIEQDAAVAEPMLRVPNSEFRGLRKEGETFTLTILSALVEWEITDLPEWCSIAEADMSGTDNKNISVTVTENSGDNTRQGTFRVTGEGLPNVNVTLSQLGAKMFMPDALLRANEAYNGRIVVVNETTGEFTLTDRGRTDTTVSSLCQTSLAGLEHYPNLKQLNIVGDALQPERNIEEVDVRAMRRLEALILNSCPRVKIVRANNLPYLKKIDVVNHKTDPGRVAIEELYAQGCLNLDSLMCISGKLRKLDVSGASSMRVLHAQANRPLSEITGLADCVGLLDLGVFSCSLTSLDVTPFTNLAKLLCRDNRLTDLDISRNNKLYHLSCGANNISELDVRHLSELQNLYCENTKVTELDLSNCPKLAHLECYNSPIGNLDLSGKTELSYLTCFGMPNLQTLNITGCSKLALVGFTHHPITHAGDLVHNSFSGQSDGSLLDLSPYYDVAPSFSELIADNISLYKGIRSVANSKLERISMQSCPALTSAVFKDNGNLRYINVTGSTLTLFDVSGNHPDIEIVGR